jgi:hypothetical protein
MVICSLSSRPLDSLTLFLHRSSPVLFRTLLLHFNSALCQDLLLYFHSRIILFSKMAESPISTGKESYVEETSQTVDVEKDASAGGAYIVSDVADAQGLKTTKNGKIILIPQPSSDPDDPLNWSWAKKHTVLLALLLPSLLTDWGMTWGTTLFELQAITWNMSVPDAARSVSGGIFLQGPGGVLAVPFVQRFGR